MVLSARCLVLKIFYSPMPGFRSERGQSAMKLFCMSKSEHGNRIDDRPPATPHLSKAHKYSVFICQQRGQGLVSDPGEGTLMDRF